MKTRLFLIMLLLTALLAAGSVSAAPWHTTNNRLANAVADECFAGIGVDYPGGIIPGDGYTTPVVCPETTPNPDYDPFDPASPEDLTVYKKTNDSYVWALTDEGDSLWFASAANVMCTTAGVFLGELTEGQSNTTVERAKQFTETGKVVWNDYVEEDGNGSPVCGDFFEGTFYPEDCRQEDRVRVPFNVCEHGNSQPYRDGLWPATTTGDWRPSKVFRHIKSTGQLINLTEQIYAAPGDDGAVFDSLLGIRCAGSHNGVVFFAGGDQNVTVTMFAFRASDGQYLGKNTFDGWRQIRKMTVSENFLYLGVSRALFGQVFVFLGDADNPFFVDNDPEGESVWVAVGTMLGAITEIAQYVDNGGGTHILANSGQGLFVSPAMTTLGGTTRLRNENAQLGQWTSVWQYSSYDPDILNITGPGGVGQLGEWAYWGTMHIPFIGFYMNATITYGGIENVPQEVQFPMFQATFRTTSIWRGRNLGLANQEIQLLYGETHLGAYIDETWQMVETGWTPVNPGPPGVNDPIFGTPMGSSGFYNPNLNYSWVVLPYTDPAGNQHLFWGTMDQTFVGGDDISDLIGTNYQYPADDVRGADLWRFSIASGGGPWEGASDTVAVTEFTNGAGNLTQYGVRCLIAAEDDPLKIYLGMANNANLQHPDQDLPGDEPRAHRIGGWELRELSRP